MIYHRSTSTALALKPAEIGNVEVHLEGELPHVMSDAAMPQAQPMPTAAPTRDDQLASIGMTGKSYDELDSLFI